MWGSAGKYLNHWGQPGTLGWKIPDGWTDWMGLQGNSRYYNYTVYNNGKVQQHGNDVKDYFTDVLHEHGIQFLKAASAAKRWEKAQGKTGKPFFMMIGTPAAHADFTPAPQYWNISAGLKAPRTPNWCAQGSCYTSPRRARR